MKVLAKNEKKFSFNTAVLIATAVILCVSAVCFFCSHDWSKMDEFGEITEYTNLCSENATLRKLNFNMEISRGALAVTGQIGLNLSESSVSIDGMDIPEDAVVYNGRSFKLYNIGSDWRKVKAFCAERGGYLASVHDQEENDFLYHYIKSLGEKGAYIGLTSEMQPNIWKWLGGDIEGLCVVKNNLTKINEPFCEFDREFYGMYFYDYKNGQWNDGPGPIGAGPRRSRNVRGFICEWEADAIDEARQKDLLPDKAVCWEVNGNCYMYYHYVSEVDTFDKAQAYCVNLGGHLATLTSPEEDEFVYAYLRSQGSKNAYFGLYVPTRTPGDPYEWVTGEPVDYVHWNRVFYTVSDFYTNWNYTKHIYREDLDQPNDYRLRQCLILGDYDDAWVDGSWACANFGSKSSLETYGTNFICAWDYALYEPEPAPVPALEPELLVSETETGEAAVPSASDAHPEEIPQNMDQTKNIVTASAIGLSIFILIIVFIIKKKMSGK